MGCNCKVNEQALKIHKEYGYESRASWKERIHFNLGSVLKLIIVTLLMILFFPIIALIITVKVIGGKRRFDVNKIVKRILARGKNE